MLRKLNTLYGKNRAIYGNLMANLKTRRKRVREGFIDNEMDDSKTDPLTGVAAGFAFKDYLKDKYNKRGRGKLGKGKQPIPGQKLLPEKPDVEKASKYIKPGTKAMSVTPKLDKLSDQLKQSPWKGRLGGAGLVAGAGMMWANQNIKAGYNDRMEQHRGYREADAPMSKPNLKGRTDLIAPSTSTSVDKNVKLPKGTLKANGKGVNKQKKPFGSVGPKKAIKPVTPKGTPAAPQVSKEQMISNRAAEYRQGMAGISMVKPPAGAISPLAVKKSPQKAKESKEFLIGSLLEAKFRYRSEAKSKERLGSNANTSIRKGTNVKHTFRTNDTKHQFSGRPLSMRQKMLSEHKRKGFALPEHYPNMSPKEIGKHFDYLTDQGMLEPRKNLDPSNWNYVKRKVKRHYRRGKKKVTNFYKGMVAKFNESAKLEGVKEAEVKTFCDFEVGNVECPEDCGCASCKELLETAGSSFGQNMRDGTQNPTPNISERVPQKETLIANIFNNRRLSKRKKFRRMRESLEDMKREQFINDELAVHRRNPEPRGLLKRRNTYFNMPSTLGKLDRLGCNVAMTALALNGLAPIARKLLSDPGGFKRAAASAVKNIKKKFKESQPFSDVNKADKRYKKKHPYAHAFLNHPMRTTSKAIKSGALKAGKSLGIPEDYIYPGALGIAALSTIGGTAYAKHKLYPKKK